MASHFILELRILIISCMFILGLSPQLLLRQAPSLRLVVGSPRLVCLDSLFSRTIILLPNAGYVGNAQSPCAEDISSYSNDI